jgi:outer membrane receptor protein involved in Fe transport
VVQIFTRRAEATDAPHATGSVEGGTFGTVRGDARVLGGLARRADYQAGITYRKTDGAFQDILPEKDWYEQTSFDGTIAVTLGHRLSVRSGVRYTHAQGRNVSSISFNVRNTQGTYDSRNTSWHTDLNHTAGSRYSATATVNLFRYWQLNADTFADPPRTFHAILEGTPNAIFPNGVRLVRALEQAEFASLLAAGAAPAPGQFLASATPGSFTSNLARIPTVFNRPAIRYQGDLDWAGGHRLSAGYEWEREEFVPQAPLTPATALTQGFPVDNNAVFLQQQSTFADRLFVTVGVRVDDKESYDTFVSPKLSVGGYIVPARGGALSSLKVFGNIGKGIKSPTFGERFGSGFSDGNPDLKVERARTGDVGVEATFAAQRLRASVTRFDNDYRDQIAFRSGSVGDGIPENINIEGARADGWELEGALQKPLHGIILSGSYSNVDTRVVTSISTSQQFQPGQPLLRRPRHSGNVRAAYTRGRATVNFHVRFVGERHDNSFLSLRSVANQQYPVPFTTDITVNRGYTVAGLGFDYEIDRQVSVYVRGNNIGDTEYDSSLGYPGLPRTWVAGARFNVGR